MKSHHFFAIFLAVLAFAFLFIYSVKSSSSASVVSCNPVNLNKVYDFSTMGTRGTNLSNVFLVPEDYPYKKVTQILNANLVGYCSTMNFNCNYYVNGVFCGTIPTNMTSGGNNTLNKAVYPLLCLSSIKQGTNILTLNLNNGVGGNGYIENLFLEMELVPANC